MADNFDLKVSDLDQITINFAGFAISQGPGATGYGEGTVITVKATNDSFVIKEGADGTVTRAKTNSRLVEITIKTMQSNGRVNGFLSAILATDEAQPNGAGVGPLNLNDLNGTSKFSASKVWVKKLPDMEWGRDPTEREWTLQGLRSVAVIGGN